MLTVTSKAKSKLKRDLYNERQNNTEYARIIYSPSNPARIGFKNDQENEDDWIISDNEGDKLLLLNPNMMKTLRSFVLDYSEGPGDRKFIIKREKII
jgi:Fe-S cluster assembly iron-binding protein IscA